VDKLFLDANVLFSAAYRDSSPLLRLWQLEDVILFTSSHAVEEARRNIALTRPDALPILEHLASKLVVLPKSKSDPSIPELLSLPEKDRPILSAALECGATHLLTGDKEHFGRFFGRSVCGILVLTPGAYLTSRRVGES